MSRTLKPHLIKFSCSACGTRLAVPLSMAGIEDHCPKCQNLVAAPLPKGPPAALEKQQLDAPPSSDVAADPQEIFPGLRASLLDDFLSGQTTEDAVPEKTPKPQKKSRDRQTPREITPELTAPVEKPQPAPASAESPLASDPGPSVEAADQPNRPRADSWIEVPEEKNPDIGMGDALASYLTTPASNVSRQSSPALGVELLHVASASRSERRSRRSRFMVAGVVLFLLVDAGFALWFFRHRIEDWLSPDSTAVVKPVTPTPVSHKHDPALDVKKEPPPAVEPPADPPAVVTPKPPDPPVIVTTPEIPTHPGTAPAPENVSPQPIPPTPVVTLIDSTLPKLPELPTPTPPVISKIDIEPPPAPPPAPVIIDLPPLPDPPAVTPSPAVENVEVAPARTALDSLKGFLAAPGISDRLRWCQKPETVRPLMEKHYTSHPDGPVKVGRIELVASYPSKDGVPPYSMFELSGGSLKNTVLALVEEKPRNEHRVDWEAFVEFKDGMLWEFMKKPDSRPQKFRVIMRRTHYFNKDVPDVGNKDGFELSQPGNEAVANVFAVRSSPVTRQLAQRLGWDAKIPATLELVWRVDGSRRWVEIQSVPSFGWRG